jgi:hypothetical protein
MSPDSIGSDSSDKPHTIHDHTDSEKEELTGDDIDKALDSVERKAIKIRKIIIIIAPIILFLSGGVGLEYFMGLL